MAYIHLKDKTKMVLQKKHFFEVCSDPVTKNSGFVRAIGSRAFQKGGSYANGYVSGHLDLSFK
jgi:hypothetical protein